MPSCDYDNHICYYFPPYFFPKIEDQFTDWVQHMGGSGAWGWKSHQEGWQCLSDQPWACRDDLFQSKLMKPRLCSRWPLCALSSSVDTWGNWAQAQDCNFSTKSDEYSIHYFHFCPSSSQGFLLPGVREMSFSSPSNKPHQTYSDFAVGGLIVQCMHYSLYGFCFSFSSTLLHYLLPIFYIYLFPGCEYQKCRGIRMK